MEQPRIPLRVRKLRKFQLTQFQTKKALNNHKIPHPPFNPAIIPETPQSPPQSTIPSTKDIPQTITPPPNKEPQPETIQQNPPIETIPPQEKENTTTDVVADDAIASTEETSVTASSFTPLKRKRFKQLAQTSPKAKLIEIQEEVAKGNEADVDLQHADVVASEEAPIVVALSAIASDQKEKHVVVQRRMTYTEARKRLRAKLAEIKETDEDMQPNDVVASIDTTSEDQPAIPKPVVEVLQKNETKIKAAKSLAEMAATLQKDKEQVDARVSSAVAPDVVPEKEPTKEKLKGTDKKAAKGPTRANSRLKFGLAEK